MQHRFNSTTKKAVSFGATWLIMFASEAGVAPWQEPPDRIGRLIGLFLAAVTGAWLVEVFMAGKHYTTAFELGEQFAAERQRLRDARKNATA